jgi:gliding motility-associated-like protein
MRFFLIFIVLFSWSSIFASHIVGGEIFYDYMGSSQYRISVVLYRDCNSTGAEYDDPLSLGIYSKSNQLVQNVLIPFPGSVNLPIVFSNPCVIPPNDICIEKAIYTTIVDLPPIIGGYTLTYQRCCRGPNVVNLVSPDGTGLTLSTHIPGIETNFQFNSSSRFSGYPPTLLCNNEKLVFNHGAIDPDGDQLVYSLIAPNSGATYDKPKPNIPPPPPYSPVVWLNGFSTVNPFGNGATIDINSSTGLLTASPKLLGLFVVGIRVQEYRNGILVGETVRDFLFRVINCEITLQASIPVQEDMDYFISYCQGLTVTFDNNSYGANNYKWDFGVPNTLTDVSTQFTPTFTYPLPGTYQATLIANPGWPCSDTSTQTIIVNEYLEVSFSTIDSICIVNNSFNFDGHFIGNNSSIFLWDFGNNASIKTSSDLDVNNVTFIESGFSKITLTGMNGTCTTSFTDSIYIFPLPTVNFSPPPNYLCVGLTVPFYNTSSGIINSIWDFGVSNSTDDVSNEFEPIFSFPKAGEYTVKLTGSSVGLCTNTAYQTLIVNDILDVWFTKNDSLCITGNSFNFDGGMIGSPTTTYMWEFGPNASISTASTLDVNNVVFNKAGTFPIKLTGYYSTNCIDTFSSSIFIYNEPTVDFTIEPSLSCAPYAAKFINLSTSDAPLSYFWDFGEGGISTLKDPIYIYDSVGIYDVGLKISASKGCIDTLKLIKTNYIKVNPSPISIFSASPLVTDICNSLVQFSDQSIGGVTTYYSFNGTAFSDEKNPSYIYTDDGIFYPKQIVTNEFMCTDTSQIEIYIEPFMVFIPNAFTPDGDSFNNEFKAVTYFNTIEWEFTIYNRWGNVIYKSNDPSQGWDGKYKGENVQDGLYNYHLKYISCEKTNAVHELRGHFSLIK